MTTPAPVAPRPTSGAPGSTGARTVGHFSEEVAERLTKDYLTGNPAAWAQTLLTYVAGFPELTVKLAGISAGELTREAIFRALQKLGIDTEDKLVRALADTPDNVIRGIVEALAETARSGATPTHAATAPGPSAAKATSGQVVRNPAGDHPTIVHYVAQDGDVVCLDHRNERDAWNKTHKPKHVGGKDGKGGKTIPAEPFPEEFLTVERAREIGYEQCPRCRPYDRAAKAAKEEKMAKKGVADGRPETGFSQLALAFLAAFGRSVDTSEADEANEVFKEHPDFLERQAREWYFDHFNEAPEVNPDGSLSKKTERRLMGARVMSDEEKEAVIRNLFVSGVVSLDKLTHLKALLESLTGKRKKAEQAKRLKEAEEAVLNAANPAVKITAEEKLKKIQAEINPPPKRLPWGIIIPVVIAVVWVVLTIATH